MSWVERGRTQGITPYGNGLFHVNSILQPCTATKAPVVGVAITAVRPVAGCGTGASREADIEEAARFCLEVAKAFLGPVGEDLADGEALALFDEDIGVHEPPTEAVSQPAAHSRFTATPVADEHHVHPY